MCVQVNRMAINIVLIVIFIILCNYILCIYKYIYNDMYMYMSSTKADFFFLPEILLHICMFDIASDSFFFSSEL